MTTLAQRLERDTKVDHPSGCWRWTAAHHGEGYGAVWWDGRVQLVHRLAYELLIGPIPDGMTIDHVRERGCRHRDCWNIDHLETVTLPENVMRGDSPPALNAAKTHCPRGHEYDVVKNDGTRGCSTCARLLGRERNRRYRQRARNARR